MKSALFAILLASLFVVGFHAASRDQRAKLIAALRTNWWAASKRFLLAVLSYAVPIYLLLFVDSCSQWTAFE
jgi:hypothetical protein